MNPQSKDLFEPWLGAGVVALFGPGAPVSKINEMCKAKHVSHWSGGGSKRTPRLYSFAAAVQIHALYQASRAGLAPRIGSGIASKALERIVTRTDQGDTLGEGASQVSLIFWQDPADRLLCLDMRPEQLGRAYRQSGVPFDSEVESFLRDQDMGPVPYSWYTLEVDKLIDALWRDYRLVTPEFNKKVVEGRIKPLPTNLG